jgi:hypothetical protein
MAISKANDPLVVWQPNFEGLNKKLQRKRKRG